MSLASSFLVYNLWILAVLSIAILSLDATFLGIGAMDTTTAGSIIVTLLATTASLLFIILQTTVVLYRRKEQQLSIWKHRARIESLCLKLPGIVIVCWIMAAAVSLVVAARQPICLPANSGQPKWQQGLSCQLHRTITALSVIIFIASCSYFCLREMANRSFGASISTFSEKGISSHSPANSYVSCAYGYDDPLYLIPETRTSRIEHEQWLQRRNSLSSQKAMFPNPPISERGQFLESRRSPSRFLSFSETSSRSFADTSSTLTASLGTTLYAPSSMTRSSRSKFSRIESNLSLAINKQKNQSHKVLRPMSCNSKLTRPLSPPPPAWCPSTLRHTPLSSDPAIQALSCNVDVVDHKSTQLITVPPAVKSECHRRLRRRPSSTKATILTRRLSTSAESCIADSVANDETVDRAIPTTLHIPPRAPGHIVRSSTMLRPSLRRPSPIRAQTQVSGYGPPKRHQAGQRYSMSSYGTRNSVSISCDPESLPRTAGEWPGKERNGSVGGSCWESIRECREH